MMSLVKMENTILFIMLCGSRKYPLTHPMEGHWKFKEGGGSQQPKVISKV